MLDSFGFDPEDKSDTLQFAYSSEDTPGRVSLASDDCREIPTHLSGFSFFGVTVRGYAGSAGPVC